MSRLPSLEAMDITGEEGDGNGEAKGKAPVRDRSVSEASTVKIISSSTVEVPAVEIRSISSRFHWRDNTH